MGLLERKPISIGVGRDEDVGVLRELKGPSSMSDSSADSSHTPKTPNRALERWSAMQRDAHRLEAMLLTWIASGSFLHEFTGLLEIGVEEAHRFLNQTVERRNKWREAEKIGEEVQKSRVKGELAKIAYSDIRRLFDERGKMLDPNLWPIAEAAAVTGFQVKEGVDKNGEPYFETKVSFGGKMEALKSLGQEHGMFAKRHVVDVGESFEQLLHGTWKAEQVGDKHAGEVIDGEVVKSEEVKSGEDKGE